MVPEIFRHTTWVLPVVSLNNIDITQNKPESIKGSGFFIHTFQHMIKTGHTYIAEIVDNTQLLFALEPNYSLE